MASPESFFQRLTRLFKSGPAIQRRVKGYDNRSYYNNKLVQGNYGYRASAPFGFGRENSPFSVQGSYNILDRMARYSEFCFHEDTLVYTTSGAQTIKELSEKYPNGEIFHVYAYDHVKKKITIGTAHHPRVTKDGIPQKLVEVVLDDGASLKTTLDHKFLLRDGSYLEACDLKPNTALMPFTMRKYNGGYHQIYALNKEGNSFGWEKEHHMVAEYFSGRKIKESEVVHHRDFNPENNRPANLEILNEQAHKKYHAQLNNRNKFNKQNKSHSEWMTNNNPARRSDITFDKIFDTAVAVDFSMKETSKLLSADMNVLKRRLRTVGFKNWKEFAANKGELQVLRTASRVIMEMQPPTKESVLEASKTSKTIYEAASFLGCTENTIRRFLQRNKLGTWSELKGNPHNPGATSKNSAFDEALSYQMICNAYTPTLTRKELAQKLKTTQNKIMTRLEREGHESYSKWTDLYENHKVKEVNFLEEESIVYNLTVDSHHNLAAGSINTSASGAERPYSMVIIRQSEMEYTPEVATAMDIYADEIVGGDDRGKCFHVFSSNPKIKIELDDLFYDILNIEFNLKPWTRNLIKHGDFFLYNEVLPDIGIVNVTPIPVNEIEREEGYDQEDPYAIRFKWLTRGNKYLENWQISHFRILSNDLFLPYGTSILESARKIWRQLCHEHGTRVWTPKGWIEIQDVKSGDDVYSFDYDIARLVKTKVVAVKHMGSQPILSVRTAHREINVTPNHGLLVKLPGGNFEYKKAGDLIIGKDCLVLPKNTVESVLPRVTFGNNDKFQVDEEFCRFFGFMLGDGWLLPTGFGFALGIEKGLNDYYRDYAKTFFGELNEEVHTAALPNKRGGAVGYGSMEAKKVFQALGFISGLGKKRLPAWIYEAPHHCKIALLEGLMDADGSSSDNRITLANKNLVLDIKTLAEMSGVATSKRLTEISRPDRQKSYRITVNTNIIQKPKHSFEKVCSLKQKEGKRETYDLQVENELHNFVAEGVVTHNTMLEDAMLVYRVVRSPERRVFYIDVGNIDPNDVPNYMEAAKATLRSNGVTDKETGKENLRLNAMSVLDDYFIPVRGNAQGTKVETLAGATHATATEDVEYIQSKLFAALKVPKPYMNYDENLSAKASLSQMDVRFSRTIQGFQKIVIAELNKLAMIHLYSKGFDGADLVEFELKLSNPSSVAQQQKLELWTVKFDAGGAAQETGLVDKMWVRKNILGLTEEEIIEIKKGLVKDKLAEMELEATEPVEFDYSQPSKTTDPFDPTNYEVPGKDVTKTPPEEDGDGQKAHSSDIGLSKFRSYDGDGNQVVIDLEPGRTPIRATPFLTRAKRNRTRRVGISTGRQATAMPDLAAMLSPRNKYNKDITGTKTEGAKKKKDDLLLGFVVEPNYGREIKSIFRRLDEAMKEKRVLLSEQSEPELELDLEDMSDDYDDSTALILEVVQKNEDIEDIETIDEKNLSEVFNEED